MAETPTTELSKSLVYLVSPRGGDNFWARTINGCDKFYRTNYGTASVSVAPNGRYVLTVDDDFFAGLPEGDQKLVLVHEAGHIVLRHLERLFRIQCNLTDPTLRKAVNVVFNIAADLAANDKIVRHEPEFADSKFPWILPEKMDYASGLSMEKYILELVKDLPQALENMLKMLEKAERGECTCDGEGEGEGDGPGINVPIDSEGGSGSMNGFIPRRGKGKKNKPDAGGSDDQSTEDPQVPPGLSAAAKNDPELIDKLEEAFEKLSKKAHDLWNKMADKMSPEEALSMSNKMKQHAKRLVRSAHEQTIRSRGTTPANVENLIKGLLAADQIPWHWLLDDALQGAIASKIIEEMAMPNTSLMGSDLYEPWPGFTLDRKFRIYWFTDTSGSVSDAEYARACACINSLLKVNTFIELVHLQGDAACQSEEITDNLEPPDPSTLRRAGYGGTVYTSQFKRILGVDTPEDWQNSSKRPLEHPGRPDLVVVYTDGGVVLQGPDNLNYGGQEMTFPNYKPDVPIIWLIAPGCAPAAGMENTPPDRVIEMFEIKGEFDEEA